MSHSEHADLTFADVLEQGFNWDERVLFIVPKVKKFLEETPLDTTYSTSNLARTLLATHGQNVGELTPALISTLKNLPKADESLPKYGFVTRGKPKQMFGQPAYPKVWKNPKTRYDPAASVPSSKPVPQERSARALQKQIDAQAAKIESLTGRLDAVLHRLEIAEGKIIDLEGVVTAPALSPAEAEVVDDSAAEE